MRDLSNIDRKALPLTSPCFGVAETSLSFRKERDVAQRQGEVTLPDPCAFLNYFQCSKSFNSPSMKVSFLALIVALSLGKSFAEEPKKTDLPRRERLISLISNNSTDKHERLAMPVLSLNRPLVIDGEYVAYNDAGVVSAAMPLKPLRSPLIAVAFSAVVPGAGEFYAESYWRSALFFVAEVALWVTALHYQNIGRQGERDFVAFADGLAPNGQGFANDGRARWDAVRFAERLSEIYTTERFLNSGLVPNANQIRQMAAELGTPQRLNEIRNRDYRFLNAFERIAVSAANNATLSHTLPPYGDQQYYELIGKYSEYAIGWYDYDVSRMDNRFEVHSAVYLQYASMRGMANQNLKTASNFFSLVVLNHALSAFDALIAVNQYNDRIRTSLQFQQDAMTQTLYPSASVAISF
jgi:hypothetical protein